MNPEEESISKTNIPKIIHQIWFQGENSIPNDYPNYSTSWKNLNPEFKYMFWDQLKIEQLLNNYFPYFKQQYFSYPKIIQKIDVAKFMILYVYGGFYIDLDSECLKNIGPLLINKQIILSKSNSDYITRFFYHGIINDVVENSFFASIKNHSFWEHCIKLSMNENLQEKTFETNEKYVFRTTGPGLVTRAYYSYVHNNNFTLLDSIYIDPIDPCEYYNYNCKQQKCSNIFPKSFAMHHYGGTNSKNGWMSSSVKNFTPLICKYRNIMGICSCLICILIIICIIYFLF